MGDARRCKWTGPAVATSGFRPPPRGAITPSVASGPEDEDAGRRASSLTTLLLFKQLCEQPAKLNIPKLPIQGDSHRRSPWRTPRSRNPRVVQAAVARQRSIETERNALNRHARPTTPRSKAHFQAGRSDPCGTLVCALSEPHALLAFRATFQSEEQRGGWLWPPHQ